MADRQKDEAKDKGTENTKPKEEKKGEAIIKEACKAYKIDPKYILSSNYYPDTGMAVIVTHGGAKVRYKKGDKVEPLDPVRVDGIPRKKPRYVAGKKKK